MNVMRNCLRKGSVRLAGTTRVRRGAAILETAVVMSLLIMLSFGTAEYGYFFFVKNMLMGAAREGARAAITSTSSNTDVNTAVANVMTAAHIPSNQYTVVTSPSTVAGTTAGTAITVTVTCTWGTVGITPLPTSMGGIATSKQVVGAAVMRREQ
jgi:Flp pilus assembly protein TadG